MLLALALALACGQAGPPSLPSAPATGDPSTTPPPSAASSTAPPPSPAPLATAQNPGHCGAGQHIWFECAVGQGRTVSLCGNAQPTWLQYHFGPPKAAALTVPAVPSGLKRFRFSEQSWAQARVQAIRFDNDGYTYLLVDKEGGGGPDGEANNFQGVVVRRGDAELQRFPCVGLLEDSGLPDLADTLEALGYSD